MIESNIVPVIFSAAFALFVSWRLVTVKGKTFISPWISKAIAEQHHDRIFMELEQLEYDFRAGKLESELYESEREKLMQQIAAQKGS